MPLSELSVDSQAKIAVVLMALIPALTCFYVGGIMATDGNDLLPFSAILAILLSMFVVAGAGYSILRKYSTNIIKLRHYVVKMAEGTLPDSIHLEQVDSSNDLQCIEDSLNLILRGIGERMKVVEEQLQVECGLRKALEQQQKALLEAERQRVMMQSLGAACHHLGQPATALRLRLSLLREQARDREEMDEIDKSIQDVEAIESILIKLRDVNEYRTEPYLASGDDESRILSI